MLGEHRGQLIVRVEMQQCCMQQDIEVPWLRRAKDERRFPA